MKKIIGFLASVLLVVTLASCGRPKFKILLPTEYLAEELIFSFQKKYNVKVKTIPFVSNEAAMVKIGIEKFDLIIPSDYSVEQLIEEDLIYPIDWNKVNIDRTNGFPLGLQQTLEAYESSDKPLVLLDYMVPYLWGNLGILYNKNVVSQAELEAEQWGIFLRSDLKKAIYDSSRDAFFMALKHTNASSPNTTNRAELDRAEQFLRDIDKSGNRVYLTDDILDDMQDTPPKYDIALAYSGDALYVKYQSKKPEIGFYAPTDGTNVFIDGFVIPKSSSDVEMAYNFINHISEYDNAIINTVEIGYVTAIKSVYEYMINNPASEFYPYRDFYMIELKENDEVFRYVPQAKREMDERWTKIRSGS